MHTLVSLCTDGERDTTAPRALVRALIDLDRQHSDAGERWRDDYGRSWLEQSGPGASGAWIWRAAYALQRLYDRSGIEEVQAIKETLPAGGYRMLEWLGVSARWADLYLRRRA